MHTHPQKNECVSMVQKKKLECSQHNGAQSLKNNMLFFFVQMLECICLPQKNAGFIQGNKIC